ncbi:MAG: hypothetical protein NZM38_01915 [Cytophagales bacterium]|nr:hypothetical protein [Cytophagales bacterium]MDW8383509.1 hypothetical protein [Flammeovirgaceae bacterium]
MKKLLMTAKLALGIAAFIIVFASCTNDCKRWSNATHGPGARHYKINRENTNKHAYKPW